MFSLRAVTKANAPNKTATAPLILGIVLFQDSHYVRVGYHFAFSSCCDLAVRHVRQVEPCSTITCSYHAGLSQPACSLSFSFSHITLSSLADLIYSTFQKLFVCFATSPTLV